MYLVPQSRDHLAHARGSHRAGKTGAPFPDSAKSLKGVVDAGSQKPKLAKGELGAKAILPEPRSVKKTMIYRLMFMHSDFRRTCNLWRSHLAVISITGVWATTALAATSVEFTSVPPYGSFNNLQGKVYGVNPATNRIAVFIYLTGAGWYTKPSCGTPLTTIQPDGTWTADITTGGADQNATRIAAYVVPASFSQPCVTNVFCLPAGVEQQAIASAITTRVDPATRSFHWSGYDWWVKTATSPFDPGPNYFSDSTTNVFVDMQGRLHLRITHVGNQWRCAEIVSQTTFGYGTYAFHLASPVDALAPNVTLGLFTWTDQPDFAHREIDFEGGRWGNAADYANAQFVVQPYDQPSHLVRYRIPDPPTNSVPSFNWQTNAITFFCATGTTAVSAIATNLLLNPGFESGTGATADNWTEFGDAYRTGTNTSAAITSLSGANSMKIFGPFNPTFGAAGAYQNLAGASAGQIWRFTGFALNWSSDPMTSTNGFGVAQLIFLDAANNPIQVNESQHFDSTTPLNQWQSFQVTGTAPAGTAAVQAKLLHVGKSGIGGSVWWDEASAAMISDPSSIAQWTYTKTVPLSCDENVRLNLWLMNGNAPINGQETEVIVNKFVFTGPDTDTDGMTDSWELAHGLNPANAADAVMDDDGDGMTNLREFLAGTDPANPASALRITSINVTGSDTRVSFSSALDKNYNVESTGILQPPNWTSVTQNVAGTGGSIQIINPGGATNAANYYRVRLTQ
jgi:hypothetical protein